METITYEYENALYVNLTNRCDCSCVFCLRHNGHKGSIYADDLWLEHEPTRQEALDDLLSRDYSQYRELQSFAQFGSDLDADTKARLAQGERIVAVLKQGRSAPVPVEKQVAILYATIHDYLIDVAVKDIPEYERGLYEFVDTDAEAAEVMGAIRATGDLKADTEEKLKAALTRYTQDFVHTH